ncbi:hypothetical protein RJT34_16197 [Clitoria ternatea]|uniref:Uncharacterized protein n=1 Tax=Clitoria ternatea TaxID=43366 RepID=A0AAN9J9S3_CLITE
MVYEENQTDVYIRMPVVILSQDAGLNKERLIKNNSNGMVDFLRAIMAFLWLYTPMCLLVDVAKVFLWLMVVGTILCASYWSAWSAREAAIEQEKHLKVT